NANLMVQKKLSLAKSHLEKQDSRAFHQEIVQAIWGYLGDKLGMKTSEFSQENIQNVLQNEQVSDDTITSLLQLINRCEMAIFAPAAQSNQMQNIYEQAAKVMGELEQRLG
ncbi:MAG: hypothetical protein ACKVTZ_12960, partial [Bacteroidia bacterium]